MGKQDTPLAFTSIQAIRDFNIKKAGGRWFSRGALDFFHTRFESAVINGRRFVTSEQMDDQSPRRYTVREVQEDGTILTLGVFHQFETLEEALDAAQAGDFGPEVES